MRGIELAALIAVLHGVYACARQHSDRGTEPVVNVADRTGDAAVGTGDAAVGAREPAAEPGVVHAGPPPGPSGCDYQGWHYALGERFFDEDNCSSCRCERSGRAADGAISCHFALCDQGTECDGGPCRSCSIGSFGFPVGTGLSCGCNECTCTSHGEWLSTLVVCDGLPSLERCEKPSMATSETSVIYLDDQSVLSTLAVRARFERGGCSPPEVRGCYAIDDGDHVSIWLEPLQPLASCRSPFFEERTFTLNPLRDELRRTRGPGYVDLDVGDHSFTFAH